MSSLISSTDIQSSIRSLRLCFYGAGSMAEAIVRGLLARGLADSSLIGMFNRSNAQRLEELESRYNVSVSNVEEEQLDMLQDADVIFLVMKPKDAAEALRKLSAFIKPNQLVVSVIAGLSIRTIEQLLEQPQPIVRTMPNTSSTIGLGATGISFSQSVNDDQRQIALAMFEAIGMATIVEESLLDVVTGVSGSGPAYIYYMMEAMVEAGKQLGLTPEAAREMTIQTVLGAAHMVKATGETPADLRRKVTSPNGTTQAALEVMESYRFSEGVIQAIKRASERAAEMGEEIERSAMK
ncbi:pyrroline-5-carboxylate reductase [Paenibacillus phyllosphaerae]|uniref:Pyrroline-5-carboxylate reductase n=1 Tax=Paenibacillus phyllosphaerae TaxID=274593 RepID=A0A7W5AX66_9BACL|nr:pyrroline-5-carboxylate reductase [Paenibacillus phyllosphaerae]MBB3110449.1 pyrroline-5-carboxylate reductase [Paenibacillus phyllosphaerae]